MQLPTIEHPTQEDIDKYHAQYVERIKQVFDKFKGQYAVPGTELEIF
jgi:hypothetical protein